jgi:hypothetical protein
MKIALPKNPKWIEESPNYWVNQETKWVVRDCNNDNVDGNKIPWVILDNYGMMFSCHFVFDRDWCMAEADESSNLV